MLIPPKPPLDLFAGWHYLFSGRYRQEVADDWRTMPGWLVAVQLAAGIASVLLPLIVAGLLLFVYIDRHW